MANKRYSGTVRSLKGRCPSGKFATQTAQARELVRFTGVSTGTMLEVSGVLAAVYGVGCGWGCVIR